MTLKELDGECDVCPIKEAGFCPGGWTCYGGEPVEPPCTSIDEDEDLDVWVSEAMYQRNVYEMYLRQQAQLEGARAEEAESKLQRIYKVLDEVMKDEECPIALCKELCINNNGVCVQHAERGRYDECRGFKCI